MLSLFTLGLYELVWLSETRQEMVSKFGLQIPPFKRVLFVEGFQVLSILAVLATLLWLAPFLNSKTITAPNNPSPSQQCLIDYAANRPITDTCRKGVNTFFGTTSPKERYSNYLAYTIIGIMVMILAGTLSLLIIVRWLKYYAAGVMSVTNGRVSQTRAINYLTLLPPTLRMLLIQAAYNEAGLNNPVIGAPSSGT
jgi:hypothetical protein